MFSQNRPSILLLVSVVALSMSLVANAGGRQIKGKGKNRTKKQSRTSTSATAIATSGSADLPALIECQKTKTGESIKLDLKSMRFVYDSPGSRALPIRANVDATIQRCSIESAGEDDTCAGPINLYRVACDAPAATLSHFPDPRVLDSTSSPATVTLNFTAAQDGTFVSANTNSVENGLNIIITGPESFGKLTSSQFDCRLIHNQQLQAIKAQLRSLIQAAQVVVAPVETKIETPFSKPESTEVAPVPSPMPSTPTDSTTETPPTGSNNDVQPTTEAQETPVPPSAELSTEVLEPIPSPAPVPVDSKPADSPTTVSPFSPEVVPAASEEAK